MFPCVYKILYVTVCLQNCVFYRVFTNFVYYQVFKKCCIFPGVYKILYLTVCLQKVCMLHCVHKICMLQDVHKIFMSNFLQNFELPGV